MRSAVAILTIVVAICLDAGCGSSQNRQTDASPFAYDESAPLRYVDRGVVNHGYPISVHDVSFGGIDGQRIDAMLVLPPGRGPFPAVLYLHGSDGDRTQFLVPATWMAARGVVTLTITMPEEEVPVGGSASERLAAQRKVAVDMVVAARRGVDALAAMPRVDDERIGVVGWSSGARVGAILAGVDRRIVAFDLLSGGSLPVPAYASRAGPALRPTILRELGAVDPLRWIAHARAGSLMLQDGRGDKIVPRSALRALVNAAGPSAEVRWYDQGHAPARAALADQLDWMAAKLEVGGPVVKGADAGP